MTAGACCGGDGSKATFCVTCSRWTASPRHAAIPSRSSDLHTWADTTPQGHHHQVRRDGGTSGREGGDVCRCERFTAAYCHSESPASQGVIIKFKARGRTFRAFRVILVAGVRPPPAASRVCAGTLLASSLGLRVPLRVRFQGSCESFNYSPLAGVEN